MCTQDRNVSCILFMICRGGLGLKKWAWTFLHEILPVLPMASLTLMKSLCGLAFTQSSPSLNQNYGIAFRYRGSVNKCTFKIKAKSCHRKIHFPPPALPTSSRSAHRLYIVVMSLILKSPFFKLAESSTNTKPSFLKN